jgi:hypothetical protein
MASFTFDLPDPSGLARDEDLVYRGSDNIVWDRINAQRLRRGLPGLAAIGLPRPKDDAASFGTTFTSSAADSNTVTIKGSSTLTEATARQIFEQQNSAGALVGLKSGQSISSLSQAEGGVTTAASQAALSLAATSTGSSSFPTASLTSITGKLQDSPVTDGITVADYSLTAPALAGIDKISPQQVQASLAQTGRLVGQGYSLVSDDKGLGKYGFSVQQLETAGLVKSGTASKYIAQDANALTDVLKSPTVWTGKNGVRNQEDLLSSVAKQDLVQTDLMSSGILRLKNLGLPSDAMSSAALAGTALAAAKDVGSTADWLQGKSLPSVPGLPSAADLDVLSRDGAFAADFADTKISDSMAQQFPAIPAVDTADRATLDAATGRVVGNDKIPSLNFSIGALPTPTELTNQLNELYDRFQELRRDAGIIEARMSRISASLRTRPESAIEMYRTIEEAEILAGDLEGIKSQLLSLQRKAEARDPPDTGTVSSIQSLPIDTVINTLISAIERARQKVEGTART